MSITCNKSVVKLEKRIHLLLNTEWEKVHRPAKPKEQADMDITEDRLHEEVMKMKVRIIYNILSV